MKVSDKTSGRPPGSNCARSTGTRISHDARHAPHSVSMTRHGSNCVRDTPSHKSLATRRASRSVKRQNRLYRHVHGQHVERLLDDPTRATRRGFAWIVFSMFFRSVRFARHAVCTTVNSQAGVVAPPLPCGQTEPTEASDLQGVM